MSFRKTTKPAKELAQPEREAIVDLLHLCVYADSHISLSETAVIADVVEVIGWDTNLSFTSYESRSVAAARVAKTDAASKKAFIEYAAERLPSKESKALAVALCSDLFASDGTESKEAALLSQIRAVLK